MNAAPQDVWPWLMQVGYRRGGLYSYDWLDRLFGYLGGPRPLGGGKESGMNLLRHRTRATTREHTLPLPGDGLIPHAAGGLTHAITVHCSRRELWPWLIQMGADRAGWYSYDLLDNGGRHSAETVLQGFQHTSVGAVFPALPGRRDGFVLMENEPTHWLVLGWPSPKGEPIVTWAFVLHEIEPNLTRLIVRARARDDYRVHGLPKTMGFLLTRLVHFIMQRKQLIEIARRAEGDRHQGAHHEHHATV